MLKVIPVPVSHSIEIEHYAAHIALRELACKRQDLKNITCQMFYILTLLMVTPKVNVARPI